MQSETNDDLRGNKFHFDTQPSPEVMSNFDTISIDFR